MNYSELVQAIQDYTQNEETSFVSNIPTFVQQAEERINRSIMLPELRKNATATMTAGNKYVARPSDFLSVFSFAVIDAAGDTTYLLDKDVSFIREAYPSSGTQAIPKYYAQFDGDYDTDEELHYYYDPPSIVTSGTSWYGTNAESALLYGSLIEAYTYMKGEADLIALYTGRYKEAMGQLTGVDIRSDRDEYRNGKV